MYKYTNIYTKTKNKGFLGSLEQPPTIPSFDSKRHRFEGNHLLHPIDVTDGGNVTDAFFPLGLGLPFGHSFGLKTAVSDGFENVRIRWCLEQMEVKNGVLR